MPNKISNSGNLNIQPFFPNLNRFNFEASVDLPTDGYSPLKVFLKIDGTDAWLGTRILIAWSLKNDEGLGASYTCPIDTNQWLSEDSDESYVYSEPGTIKLSNCHYLLTEN